MYDLLFYIPLQRYRKAWTTAACRCHIQAFSMMDAALHKGGCRTTFPLKEPEPDCTLGGAFHFRLPVSLQRYNTLDFPWKVVCQRGAESPLESPPNIVTQLSPITKIIQARNCFQLLKTISKILQPAFYPFIPSFTFMASK